MTQAYPTSYPCHCHCCPRFVTAAAGHECRGRASLRHPARCRAAKHQVVRCLAPHSWRVGLTPTDNRPRRLRPRRCGRPLRRGGCDLAHIRQGDGHACRGDEGRDRPAALLQPGSRSTLLGRVARRPHAAHPRYPGGRRHEIVRPPAGAPLTDAHATHTPRHAHAMHTPCTRHAHAMHTPCTRHAWHVHMHVPCRWVG